MFWSAFRPGFSERAGYVGPKNICLGPFENALGPRGKGSPKSQSPRTARSVWSSGPPDGCPKLPNLFFQNCDFKYGKEELDFYAPVTTRFSAEVPPASGKTFRAPNRNALRSPAEFRFGARSGAPALRISLFLTLLCMREAVTFEIHGAGAPERALGPRTDAKNL